MDPKTLHPFRTLYGSLKGALMVPLETPPLGSFERSLEVSSRGWG